jgi:hypothetical protein
LRAAGPLFAGRFAGEFANQSANQAADPLARPFAAQFAEIFADTCLFIHQQALVTHMKPRGYEGGATLFAESAKYDPDYEGDAAGKANHLEDLIQRLVHPKEAWESEGGRSVIEFVVSRGQMFIYTTEEAHKQIDLLLRSILPADKKNVAVDIQVVELDRAALGGAAPPRSTSAC